jgi:hypothetical protein
MLRAAVVLLVLGLAGCTPFVLASNSQHFAASEYTVALVDGTYAISQPSMKLAVVANRPHHVEIALEPDDDVPRTLIGGFIALKIPGHYIFQATDATENGAPVQKKPTENSTYIPVRIANSGEISWYIGPKKHCDMDCAALLSSYGFQQVGGTDWIVPKNLSRTVTLAFYEDLASLLERSPDNWEAVRTIRIAGS